MRLKHFLETMASLTGWQLTLRKTIRQESGCPLTAVCAAKTGLRWSVGNANSAAARLGIPYDAAVINAADGDPNFPGDHDYGNVAALRVALLKAAGL